MTEFYDRNIHLVIGSKKWDTRKASGKENQEIMSPTCADQKDVKSEEARSENVKSEGTVSEDVKS